MKTIPLTRGMVAIIDDEDFEMVSQFNWFALRDGKKRYFYAARRSSGSSYIRMHREIIGAIRGEVVDHINHDTLNNCRSNLRKCSIAENVRNGLMHTDNLTGFKGVHKSKGRFAATIMVDKKKVWLGRFATPEEAHAAYCEAAKEHHGEFACTQ